MEVKVDRPPSSFWNKALERYRSELDEEEVGEYQTILEAGTFENLVDQIKTLEPPNAKEKAVVNRLDSILKFINDFSAVIAICFGADAKLAALVWGSIRMILMLASSTSDTFRDVVDMLEELSLILPRFRYYEKSLPIDDAFESALVDVYTEVICFYARTIHFYRVNPHGLLQRNAWVEFHGDFSKTIQRIKRLSSTVESEAEAARMRLDRSGYAEVLDVMKSLKESKLSNAVKSCYCVPYNAKSHFWGRDEIFERVTQALNPASGQQILQVFFLWGMGGVGKTQIAIHYASRSRDQYDATLWVSAANTIQMSQSFRTIAVRLELVRSEQESEDANAAMAKVKQWLIETDNRWLLIFDNVDDAEIVRHAWPHDAKGSILLTTRNSQVAFERATNAYQVEPFDDTEGSNILLKLAHLDSQQVTNQVLAKTIAHTLGGLPLALSQVGGFIHQRKVPLKDFLPLYERNACRIDAKKTSITNYEHSLSTVWETSLDNLDGPAYMLQALLTFLDPDKVDEVVLTEGSKNVGSTVSGFEFLSDEMDLLDAEETLLQFAFVNKNVDTGVLSVHRLVQAAVMRRLSSQERSKYSCAVIGILTWGFPDTWSKDVGHQHQSWETSEKCLPHVLHLVKQKKHYGMTLADADNFAQLLLRCCWYLYERECYDTALELIGESLSNFSNKQTLAFSSAVELQGLIDMDMNFQDKALASFTRVMDIRTGLLGQDDAFIAASFTTLGIVHTELGNLKQAFYFHQQAIDIRLRTQSDRIGNSYSNISSLLLRMGKANEAEEMLKRCPSLKDFTDDTFLNTRNPRFSGDMLLLARIRKQQGRLEEALRLASKALGFRQNVLGNRLKVCDSLYYVADLLHLRGNSATAIDLLHECITISGSLSEGDGQYARANYKLSQLYHEQGKEKESDEFLEKARVVRRKICKAPALEDNESITTYDKLNLWMLW